ncbi:MAG TPA: SPOR domain-containing protein [Gemmatimonadaceae bacterium]|nr:SPOR domain-containing protein [Gemmatimonadaceae bacterium]
MQARTPRATSLVRGVRRVIAACGSLATLSVSSCTNAPRVSDAPLPSLTMVGGPEYILLRVPRNGGFPRSYRWPSIDDVIWAGTEKLPPVDRILAFDDGGGLLAFAATDGRAGRIDLRTGRIQLSTTPLTAATSADGYSLFGFNPDGRVARLTPTAEWKGPAAKADTVLALPSGNVAVVDFEEDRTRLIRLHPPANTPAETLDVIGVQSFTRSPGGDRLYARTTRGMLTVDAREWRVTPGPRARRTPLAVVTTPSGDRALILDADGRTIRTWLRYGERFGPTTKLDTGVNDLRMDPLGRFLLARRDLGDSAVVISIAVGRVIATVATDWRADLPAFAPNGQLLTLRRDDVIALDPVAGGRRVRVRGGGLDLWQVVRWDGFRPRDRSLDAPVTFETDAWADSAASAQAIDSLLAANAALAAAERQDSIGRAAAAGRGSADSSARVFTLQFAALFSESSARALSDRIRVDGRQPRVVATSRDGTTIYRVVLGPYPTRDAAEAAGRRSGWPYFVYPGLP